MLQLYYTRTEYSIDDIYEIDFESSIYPLEKIVVESIIEIIEDVIKIDLDSNYEITSFNEFYNYFKDNSINGLSNLVDLSFYLSLDLYNHSVDTESLIDEINYDYFNDDQIDLDLDLKEVIEKFRNEVYNL